MLRAAKAAVISVIAFLLLAAGCGVKLPDGQKTAAGRAPEKIIVQAPIGPPTAPLLKMAEDGLPGGTKIELIIYKSYL